MACPPLLVQLPLPSPRRVCLCTRRWPPMGVGRPTIGAERDQKQRENATQKKRAGGAGRDGKTGRGFRASLAKNYTRDKENSRKSTKPDDRYPIRLPCMVGLSHTQAYTAAEENMKARGGTPPSSPMASQNINPWVEKTHQRASGGTLRHRLTGTVVRSHLRWHWCLPTTSSWVCPRCVSLCLLENLSGEWGVRHPF